MACPSSALARVGAAVAAVSLLTPAPAAAAATGQRAAIPAYWSPADPDGLTTFRRLAQNRPTTGMVVLNGSLSRPEVPFSPAWAEAIEAVHDSGARVLVYVDTGYFGLDLGQGAHPTRGGGTSTEAWAAQIRRDVDEWYELYGEYGVDGVFLDQAPHVCGPDGEYAARYAEVRDHVRAAHPHAHIAINPGTGTEQCYDAVADTILSFEGDQRSYLAHVPPAWESANRDREKFWHLVYDVPTAQDMAEVVARTKANGAGYAYVTDRPFSPSTWDWLTSYWDAELAAIGGVVDTTPPGAPRGVTAVAAAGRVVLRWRSALDNVAVSGYEVLRDGEPVGTTYDTAFTAANLSPGTGYAFTVRARDVAGNASAPSAPVTVTTPPAAVLGPSACLGPTTAHYRATFTRDFPHRRVFIDADDDPSTGWALPPGLPSGADHLVENDVLFRYTGPGWAWEPVTGVEQEVDGAEVTWRVPVAAFGGSAASTQVVVFNGNDGQDEYSAVVTTTSTGEQCPGG
ncbi:spherulation-specific family 4 protein [Actinosynnema sp. NPDC050436]|uniref:spherulation-specific family 4 protein n=1 Tax=Actinosynnema sp. NPDC050436 TaxID=3155659 RepID=UPI003401B1B7